MFVEQQQYLLIKTVDSRELKYFSADRPRNTFCCIKVRTLEAFALAQRFFMCCVTFLGSG